MRVLVGGQWREGFLDYHRDPGEYRLSVRGWMPLERLDDLYFVRSRSLRLLWDYLREIGPMALARKVLSRSRERYRNEKIVACGVGEVLEAPPDAEYSPGRKVGFIAPCHPSCVERIVLPAEMLTAVEEGDLSSFERETILCARALGSGSQSDRWWAPVRGWSVHSGTKLSADSRRALARKIQETLRGADWAQAEVRSTGPSVISERVSNSPAGSASTRKRAVLFGYGNYAKSVVLPNVRSCAEFECVHEIDPLQIPVHRAGIPRWDTAPSLRDDEEYDAVFIAGFHHTHAPLAEAALERGAYAVVEKPVVVDESQLTSLVDAMRRTPGRLVACFHKRYLPFNARVRDDLGLTDGEPLSYHCIVYEVPLPELHWYRWPSSKSRLVSNGCHWLDHFLYLNGFSRPTSSSISRAGDGTVNCSVELKNGAFFTMVLTDRGSDRIGVQDYIELRARGATVRMINGSDYRAELPGGKVRTIKINRMQSYTEMYREIGRKIRDRLPGDSVESVEVSARLMLDLDDRYRKQRTTEEER